MTDLRSVIEDHWTALGTAPPRGTWQTSALPVDVAGSPVLCASGPGGTKHLLVPAPTGRQVEPDTRAAAVHLSALTLELESRSRNYANLALLRSDLSDIFTALCADVLLALALAQTDPLVAVAAELDRWHELFRSGRRLGVEQLAGLFGELTFLNTLLDLDPKLVRAWQGPLRSPHDFVAGRWAVEVKATASSEGRSIRVHGMDQMMIPADGGLMILWMRLDTGKDSGRSLPQLVDSTVPRTARPQELWHLLARAGYLLADREKYDGIRFDVVEEAAYRVAEDFPRIVPSSFAGGVPAGLSDLRYTLDLDSGAPPMQKDEIADFLNTMAGR